MLEGNGVEGYFTVIQNIPDLHVRHSSDFNLCRPSY